MKPSSQSREVVAKWLEGSGAKDIQHRDEWIHFRATATQANSLMNTQFLVYRSLSAEEKPAEEAIRTTKVLLPREIHPHIKMIHPTTRFGMMRAQRSVIHKVVENPVIDGECTNYVNPACLKALYKLPSQNKLNPAKSGLLGVTGFLTQYARFRDLTTFLKSQAPWANGANFTYSVYNGMHISENKRLLTVLQKECLINPTKDPQLKRILTFNIPLRFRTPCEIIFTAPEA
jgi:tripeptidyl-peptidase-1